jgi:hypothetical protein
MFPRIPAVPCARYGESIFVTSEGSLVLKNSRQKKLVKWHFINVLKLIAVLIDSDIAASLSGFVD